MVGRLLSVSHLLVTQTHRHRHTHAHARVHMARACSRAHGAHWYPGVAERAHTHMQTATSFYSRSPVITHKQNSHSSSRPHVPRRVPGGIRAPLTFPPLNPERSLGQLPGGAWRGAPLPSPGRPCLRPPQCSRSWTWGRWPRAAPCSRSGAGTQGPTLPSSGAHSSGLGGAARLPDAKPAWIPEKRAGGG